jgi:hypothetical protein
MNLNLNLPDRSHPSTGSMESRLNVHSCSPSTDASLGDFQRMGAILCHFHMFPEPSRKLIHIFK